MKTQEELAKLRDISSQKQSSLNALLSEKQSLNSTISEYRSLNQTSRQEYGQSLQRLQDIETEISQYDQSIAGAESSIKVLEDKLSKISKFEDFMGHMSSILSKYAAIERKTIDTSTMMVKALPEKEILNSELSKEVCKKKCLEAFEQLLVKLDDVNAVDSEGRTLLMHSLSNGFFPAVDILLSNPNIDFNITDNNGCNALIYACAMPRIEYIERIIDATDNINLRNNQAGDTALHLLLKNAGMDSVFSDEINLIKQAAGDNSNDLYCTGTLVITGNLTINGNLGGLRPDGYSLNQYKSLLICRQLNAQGADFSVLNNGGLSPYVYLCRNQQRYLANCLEDEGILDLNLLDENGFQGAAGKLLLKDHAALQDFIDNHPNCLEGGDANGNTLLHFAVQMRDLSLVQLIMNSGANQNIKNITNGLTPLFFACSMKEKAIAKYLIEQSPDLSIVDNSGFDSFLWSSELGDGDLMQKLIDKGCNINVQDKSGKTTLFWMVMYGNGDMVNWLLANGAKTNITDSDGSLPIHAAAQSGNVDMLKLMPSNDVNITTDNPYKITPLWIACQNGHLDAVKFLLENGADPNLSRLDNGVSPLLKAMSNKHINVVKQLLGKDNIDLTDLTHVDKTGTSIIHHASALSDGEILQNLIDNNLDINIADNQGFYPIHAATHHGHTEIMDILLANGVDINIKSQDGTTPLYYSLGYGRQKINIDLVKFLLEKGADPNIEHQNGLYPVHAAINSKDVDVLQLFVKNSEGANKTGASGTTPLYFAVNNTGDIEIVNYLLEKGALPNAADKDGFTPIYSATQHGRLDIIKTLVSKGAHIEEATECGDTPIAMAAYKGHIDIIKYFEDLGANLNIKNKNGDTPIHEAHMGAKIAAVDYLIERNANINAGNLQGKTPLHFLLEWKDTPLNEKIALLSKYIKQYDLSTQDKDGKTPIDYAKEYCPKAIEYLSLDSFIKDSASTDTSIHSSIFDDSQSLIASHVTSETSMLGDQDSDSAI